MRSIINNTQKSERRERAEKICNFYKELKEKNPECSKTAIIRHMEHEMCQNGHYVTYSGIRYILIKENLYT